MGIFDIFNKIPQTTTTVNGQPSGTSGEGEPITPTENVQQPIITTENKPEAPLDAFSKLWETDPTATAPNSEGFLSNIDPTKVFEAVKNANFAGTISQENLTAISQGGEPAIRAFQEALNSATQAVFAQSTLATTKIVEKALAEAKTKYDLDLPNLVRKHAAFDSLHTENPALSNPAALPIISAIQAQLSIKHPNATATQLTTMAKDYLDNFAKVVAPKKATDDSKKSESTDVDWSTFLN